MTGYVTFQASSAAYHGTKKPHIAKIVGLGGKFGFEREFLANPARIFEPTLIEVGDVDKKDRKDSNFEVAVIDDTTGELRKIKLREETAVEILQSGRPLAALRCKPRPDGKGYGVRTAEGELLWIDDYSAPPQNPLSAFSDEEIRAEFARRGL